MADYLRYMPFVVYENILKMLPGRNVNIKHKILNQSELSSELNHIQYVKIEGTRNEFNVNKKIVIILFSPKTDYADARPTFEKLYNSLLHGNTSNIELMFISGKSLSNNIKKFINDQRKKQTNIYVEHYTYEPFSYNLLENDSIMPHRRLTEQESDDLLSSIYKTKDRLPKISANDPPVVWIGGKPGDIIKIDRVSENTGESVAYRLCIRG